jgi:anti-sigma factor RsiW
MPIHQSDWQELARLTQRLDDLHNQLETAETESKIAMIYALEEQIAETEKMREQVFSRLHDRVTEEAAA